MGDCTTASWHIDAGSRGRPPHQIKRGLQGVKLVISDAHEGLKGAIRRQVGTHASWQRCSVHWLRNAMAYVPKGQQTMVAAGLRQALLQPDQDGAHRVWRSAADQFRDRWPKLGAFMDDSGTRPARAAL